MEWSSYVRGHHIYWTPTIGEIPDNSYYQFSVAVIKNRVVVGHVPRVVSRLIFHFLSRYGHTGVCEVIGNRLNRGSNLGIAVKSPVFTDSMVVRDILID